MAESSSIDRTDQTSGVNIEEIGRRGEHIFQEWGNYQRIDFHKNDQSLETFAVSFRNTTKRTDYEISLPDLGKIAVDVKVLKLHTTYGDFILDAEEIHKQKSFQRKFQVPVWFAIIPRNGLQYRTFYWVSLNYILDQIQPKHSQYGPFYPISRKDCITVGWDDGIEKLFKISIK